MFSRENQVNFSAAITDFSVKWRREIRQDEVIRMARGRIKYSRDIRYPFASGIGKTIYTSVRHLSESPGEKIERKILTRRLSDEDSRADVSNEGDGRMPSENPPRLIIFTRSTLKSECDAN